MRFNTVALPWLNRLRRACSPSHFARGVSLVFAIQVAGVSLAYLLHVLLARWMGAAEYGKYAYALSWATLLSVLAGLGLHVAVLRFVPEYRAKGRPDLLRGIVRRSWRLTVVVGTVIALLGCWVASRFVANEYSASLMLGVWMIPLIALTNFYAGTSQALRRVTAAFAPTLVMRPLLLLGGALILFLAHGRVDSQQVLAIALATLLTIVVLQGAVLRRDLSPEVNGARPAHRSREWFSVATPLLLSTGFGTLSTQAGVLMVGTLSSPDAVGLYNAALKAAMLITLVITAANAFTAPMVASLHSQGKREELQRLLTRAAHIMFWPSLGIAAAMLGFSATVLGSFGEEFTVARSAMAVLILGQVVNAGVGMVGRLSDLTGYHRQGAWVRGCGALLTVLLSAVLIPLWGILGAAIAAAVSLNLTNIWLHRLATKNLGLRPSILSALPRSREAES